MTAAGRGPVPLETLAADLGLGRLDCEPRGWNQAKLAHGLTDRLSERPLGQYVGVTAINPTPLGEGKTVVAIGLAMALCRLGRKSIVTLRQPSLAPVFGIKGGGAGGGRSSLFPAEDINLHFTGDLHAIAAAHNLLAALADNHVARHKSPELRGTGLTWRRAIDNSDKGLAHIVSGLGGHRQAAVRETGFDLTAASEVMAVLALSTSLADLRARLGRIVVGLTDSGDPVTARDLQGAGAMAALLKDAVRPNLVQTCEGTPAIVHAGPFANISHGNCSVLADQIALRLADFVVTESGFGADCGAEKLFDIKCRVSGLRPAVEVLVCTARGVKLHSGQFDVRAGRALPAGLLGPNREALRAGAENLRAHIEIIRQFGIPVVVAVNRFPEDDTSELDELASLGREFGATDVAMVDSFRRGSEGALALAESVARTAASESSFRYLYEDSASCREKIAEVAVRVYGADGVDFDPVARDQIARFDDLGFGNLPICIAKTQYSLSHDPKRLGRPRDYRFPIREVRLAAGAGYLYALAGDISTMPGLPADPAATRIDITADGQVTGLC